MKSLCCVGLKQHTLLFFIFQGEQNKGREGQNAIVSLQKVLESTCRAACVGCPKNQIRWQELQMHLLSPNSQVMKDDNCAEKDGLSLHNINLGYDVI